MKIIIRSTKLSDINQMMAVNEITLPENYDKIFWEYKFHEAKQHSFVAIGMGEVIGYIFADDESIISFAILNKFCNKGVGKNLMHHCLNTYTKPVTLHVRISNKRAIHLYESIGFIYSKLITNYYNKPDEDAHEMTWFPGTKHIEHKKINIV